MIKNQWSYSSYLLTYLLTLWYSVLLEKLTGLQLVKKFPAFHGTRRFITALTSVRHLSLSWARPIQSIYTHPTSWRSILILSTHLRLGLPSGSFPPVSPPRPYTHLFAATILIGGRSSIRNLRTRHAMVTGTHYMGSYSSNHAICL